MCHIWDGETRALMAQGDPYGAELVERKQPIALALVVSGLLRRHSPRHGSDSFQMNPILQSSPIQTWSLLSQRTQGVVRIFTCTDAPLAPSEHVAGRWVFESHSQFARLLTCLQFIEPNLAQPRHTSYLRLRPDSLVLGGLPPFVLNRPHPDAVYARWRYYDHSHVRGQLRDSMECGACDQWCECAQRKYGQVLFHTNGSDCGVPTDRTFFFGRSALQSVIRALRNYSKPDGHPARSPELQSDHCVNVGRMVETGFGRVLEDEGLRLLSLPFRHALQRELQLNTPKWKSVTCMLAWGENPISCDQPCNDLGSNRTRVRAVGFMKAQWQGCNPVNKI